LNPPEINKGTKKRYKVKQRKSSYRKAQFKVKIKIIKSINGTKNLLK